MAKTAREKFLENPDFVKKAREISQEKWFRLWISAAQESTYVFWKPNNFHENPHIQARIDAGTQAMRLFLNSLESLTYTDPARDSPQVSFISPLEASKADLI